MPKTKIQDENFASIERKASLMTGAGSGLSAALCKLLAAPCLHVMTMEPQPNPVPGVAAK